jgi:hypothetical protein
MTPAQIAAAQRRARGWRMPAMRRGVDTFERADDPMALRALIVRAGHGDVDAQWNLGAMYVGGDGVLKSCAKAARWLRQAADRGHAAAQFLLGWMHRKGEGVPQDDAMALMWWHLAAAQEVRGAAAVRDRFAAIVAREQVAEAQALLDRRRTARRRLN